MAVGTVVDGGSSGREDAENVGASCGAGEAESVDGDEPLAGLPTVSEEGVALAVLVVVAVLVLVLALELASVIVFALVSTPVGSRGASRASGGDASDDDDRRGLS